MTLSKLLFSVVHYQWTAKFTVKYNEKLGGGELSTHIMTVLRFFFYFELFQERFKRESLIACLKSAYNNTIFVYPGKLSSHMFMLS